MLRPTLDKTHLQPQEPMLAHALCLECMAGSLLIDLHLHSN